MMILQLSFTKAIVLPMIYLAHSLSFNFWQSEIEYHDIQQNIL